MRRPAPLPLLLLALLAGGCAAPTNKGCILLSDCAPGTYCFNGSCRRDCRADFDCRAREVCETVTGRCFPASAVAAGPRDGAARDLGVADLGSPADLAEPPLDLVAARLRYGDPCADATQCRPLQSGAFKGMAICSVNPFANADRECAGDCVNGQRNQGCLLGDFCVANATCVQSDVGRPCTPAQGGKDCRGGACLAVQGLPGSAFCTRVCQSAADCPAGYSCSAVQGTRVCVNLDATPRCAKDADCWYGTACDIPRARCLGACLTPADCPLFHGCVLLGNRQVCAPNKAAGRGGLGAPCQSGNECRGGLCLHNACVGACAVTRQQGQHCPGGWGCNPVEQDPNVYTLACLPAGGGSLGDPCQGNEDCATGLCVDQPGYCSRYCNDGPCPSNLPKCDDAGITADGVALKICGK